MTAELTTDHTVEAEIAAPEPEPVVDVETLVEDVSIDGMCGVY